MSNTSVPLFHAMAALAIDVREPEEMEYLLFPVQENGFISDSDRKRFAVLLDSFHLPARECLVVILVQSDPNQKAHLLWSNFTDLFDSASTKLFVGAVQLASAVRDTEKMKQLAKKLRASHQLIAQTGAKLRSDLALKEALWAQTNAKGGTLVDKDRLINSFIATPAAALDQAESADEVVVRVGGNLLLPRDRLNIRVRLTISLNGLQSGQLQRALDVALRDNRMLATATDDFDLELVLMENPDEIPHRPNPGVKFYSIFVDRSELVNRTREDVFSQTQQLGNCGFDVFVMPAPSREQVLPALLQCVVRNARQHFCSVWQFGDELREEMVSDVDLTNRIRNHMKVIRQQGTLKLDVA